MLSLEYREAITETLDILKHTEKEDINKIPIKFIKFLEENSLLTYQPNLNHNINIEKMNLKNKTREILALICKKYW